MAEVHISRRKEIALFRRRRNRGRHEPTAHGARTPPLGVGHSFTCMPKNKPWGEAPKVPSSVKRRARADVALLVLLHETPLREITSSQVPALVK